MLSHLLKINRSPLLDKGDSFLFELRTCCLFKYVGQLPNGVETKGRIEDRKVFATAKKAAGCFLGKSCEIYYNMAKMTEYEIVDNHSISFLA